MKFIEAELEKRAQSKYKKPKKELDEFMYMQVKSAKVIFTKAEYSCPQSARTTLNQCAKRHGLPIKSVMINGNVYLIRTDL